MSPIVKLSLLGMATLGLLSLGGLNSRALDYIQQLPLEGKLKQGVQLVSTQTPEPLVALKTAIPATTPTAGAEIDVDRAFLKSKTQSPTAAVAVPVAVEEVAPDFKALVRQGYRLGGVATGGAFINGKFTQPGTVLGQPLWMGKDGKTPHVAKLTRVSEKGVVISVPKAHVSIFLKAPA